ncbi:hypothetical protein LCGC14_1054590 [marine sediment metagenome]|uniref:Terminase large subunit gp17-like C-terminal domain-containing protein n=1 Tax=marine sediment metagenome TaxID=412755 RepID=A0A0F9N9P6_9ZZZZ
MEDRFLDKLHELKLDQRKEVLESLSPDLHNKVGSIIRDDIGRDDPVWWIEDTFNEKLWHKQKEIVRAINTNPRVMVKSCHSAGKSYVAAKTGIWFLETHSHSIVLTTAPTFRQVKQVLWQEIRRAYRGAQKPVKLNILKNLLKVEAQIDDKWYAFGFSTDDPDAFNGIHAEHILVIFDEASGIPPEIWESAKGVLSSGNAHLLGIGNPTDPSSMFAMEFKEKSIAYPIRISAYDTPNMTEFNITEDLIAESDYDYSKIAKLITGPLPYPALTSPFYVWDAYHTWGPNSPAYSARVLGEFPEQGEDTLIPLNLIEDACRRNIPPGFPKEFSHDVAYMGSDYNVLIYRQGDYTRVIDSWNKLDTDETAQRIIHHSMNFATSLIKIDVIGYGAGVADQLVKYFGESRVLKINVAEAPTIPSFSEELNKFHDKQFLNYRAELYWRLREKFEQGTIDIDPHDEDLKTELSMLKYKIENGKIKIESKDDMRKRLRRSPDRADTLAYAFAEKRTRDIPLVRLPGDLTSRSRWKSVV